MDELEVAASVPGMDVDAEYLHRLLDELNPGDSGLHHAQATSEELPALHKEDDADSPEHQKVGAELCTVSICLKPMQFLP
jgi:hypothetical protein